MKRDGAVALLEFTEHATFLRASELLMKAFPDRKFLTGIGFYDGELKLTTHQIVLNTENEVTYFKLIESTLEDEI